MLALDEIKIKLKEIKYYLSFHKTAYLCLSEIIEYMEKNSLPKNQELEKAKLIIEDNIVNLETKQAILKRKFN